MHIWLKETRVLARIHPKNDRHRIPNIQRGLSWKLHSAENDNSQKGDG